VVIVLWPMLVVLAEHVEVCSSIPWHVVVSCDVVILWLSCDVYSVVVSSVVQ